MTITFPTVHGNDEVYMDCLRLLAGNKRNDMIDLGCNLAPHTRKLLYTERLYVDILPRDLGEEQHRFRQVDILDIPHDVTSKKWDASFCLDVIEHLTKEDGWKLLKIMEDISERQILFTPMDPWMMTTEEDKNPESHRSLWRPEDIGKEWFKIVFPVYHPSLQIGAWFFANGIPVEEQENIIKSLSQKQWAYNMTITA
jgi:hypothetical protein